MKKIYYLIHSKSFGDTLAATPTLRYLSQSHEQKINVVTHNRHIFENNPHVDECLSFDSFRDIEGEFIKYESFTFAGRKDNNGIEKKFSHMDTRQLHAMDLGFQLMPHQMEYDYSPDFVELEYDLPEKYVVCHITQNWPNRTWDTEKWQNLIDWLSSNRIFTVLIGKDHSEKVHDSISTDPLLKSCPKLDNLYGLDLCNKIGLNEMYQVIKGGSCLITMDTGPLHISGCTDTHILQVGTARNPILSAPYRNNSYDYKYEFVGGECNIFCNSNLKYNIKEWGDINSVAPLTGCSENKSTFECHPPVEKVIDKLKEILDFQEKNKYLEFFDLLPDGEEDRINFNFKKTSDDEVKIVIKDVKTGLTRDKFVTKCQSLTEGNYWWTPMPGKIKNLGPIDMEFYLNGEFCGKKRIQYPGGKEISIEGNNLYLDYLEGNEYPTFWEIFINGDYERERECVVEEGDVVIDIGANYGFFSLDSISKGASKVYSIEPYSLAFDHLKKLSLQHNKIVPINKAVSSEDGEVFMHFDSDASATNCVTTHSEIFSRPSSGVSVGSVNINTFLSSIQEKVNFLKIDCEGSELEIFKTISQKNIRSVDKIVVETHGEEIDNFVYRSLLDNNFRVYKHEGIIFAINNV